MLREITLGIDPNDTFLPRADKPWLLFIISTDCYLCACCVRHCAQSIYVFIMRDEQMSHDPHTSEKEK